MRILKELTGPAGFETFFARHIFREPYSAAGTAKRFVNLVDWPLLDQIFEQHNNCWIAKNGKLSEAPHLNTGKLSPAAAREAFANGQSVVVRHSEAASRTLNIIAADFQAGLGGPVDVQLYATPRSHIGFGWHYDVEDVFVIQARGEKEFRLLANTVTPRPLSIMTVANCRFQEEKSTPELRCWLKAGDFLYIPAGYWHTATAITDSFHMSVGVMRKVVMT
jgi:hypothetical protein